MDVPKDQLELQRLQALEDSGLLTLPAPPELEAICREAQAHFRTAVAMVTLLTRDRLIAKVRVGTDLEEVARLGQFCDLTIRSDRVLVVPDAAQDPRFAANPLVTGAPFLCFYAGAPLIYLHQIRLGALCLLDPVPRTFSLGDEADLVLLAEEVIAVIVGQEIDLRTAPLGLDSTR